MKIALTKIDIRDRPLPPEFFEHNGFVLNTENNQLQEDLDNLKVFTRKT